MSSRADLLHTFTCPRGHAWASCDAAHHALAVEMLCDDDDGLCPHEGCGQRAERVACPPACTPERRRSP